MISSTCDLYSFRSIRNLFADGTSPATGATAALAAIEAALVQANLDYLDHRYQPAIEGYQRAERLVFAQLYPLAGPNGPVSRNPQLFGPLLSIGAEWLNVLPVVIPNAAVRPRDPIDPQIIGDAGASLGLRSSVLSTRDNAAALADLRYGQLLEAEGNLKASTFYHDRANTAAPDLLKAIETPSVSPTATSPAPAPGPVARDPAISPAGPLGRGPLIGHLDRVTNGGGLTGTVVAPDRPIGARVLGTVPSPVTAQRTFGFELGGTRTVLDWKLGDPVPVATVRDKLYQARIAARDLEIVNRVPMSPGDFALDLPHIYFYVIPLGLAECHHALGDYAAAETKYLEAAGYQYLNAAVEAPYLWSRLATLYLDWGNSFFRDDDAASALPYYERVIMSDDSVPAATLYQLAALKPGADVARVVLSALDHVSDINVDPAIAAPIVEVRGQIIKIKGGLDFWGFWTKTVPIWTFEYLQNVASNFAQLAISVERDVVSYWDRAGQSTLTRQQIVTATASANAEVTAADLQTRAASAEQQAFSDAVDLAAQRAANARANAAEYATKSDLAVSYQASSSQISGGDDGDPNELNRLADQLLSGHSISGSRGTIAAATQLAGAKANRQYEIDSLNRQASEMDLAKTQAQAELTAARARVGAARAAADVARIRARGARALLRAFDDQFFTPEVWQRMGDTLYRLYRRYLAMAIRAARLMQQAYNFETDQSLALIRGDYSSDEVKGLLAADALLADIQTFTYDLVTSRAGKPQPLKQTISLAERYPFAFETQLRRTGVIAFETRIDDFDLVYPGTYAGRVENIEVEVDGLVPPTGISGTLTNAGISSYRVPAVAAAAAGPSGLKHRVQSRETLVLSDYRVRMDGLLTLPDQRMLRVFQGAGVASSWRLELPKAVNDLDYGALLDVRLTFYYKARYDPDLAATVKAELAARPGINSRQRGLPMRWVAPDAFFLFQDTGQISITLGPQDFAHNETAPILTSVGILVATGGGLSAQGLKVGLATPAHQQPILLTTDATGAASSIAGGSPWSPLIGGTALGSYLVTILGADNPALAPGGRLDLSHVVNVVLLMAYSFTPRS